MSYALEGGTNLAAHVGHRVSVTGTLMPMPNAGAAAPGAASGSSSAAGRSAHMTPKLQVNSVQMISTECPSGGSSR
jgi:hypothetical protein